MLFSGVSHTAPFSPTSSSSANATRSGTSPPLQADQSPQTPPSRPSRLRGLSYLRHQYHHSNSSNPSSDSESKKPSKRLNARRSNTIPLIDVPGGEGSSTAQSIARDQTTIDPQPPVANASADLLSPAESSETRRRSTSAPPLPPALSDPAAATDHAPAGRMDTTLALEASRHDRKLPPQIRFLPHNEASRGRPSLDFRPISRVLPDDKAIIRVGRYSERDTVNDAAPSTPSDAPVGFKSKVVSRRHCEFFYERSQWFIKDVKSSSGTFLNHIRLSQPNTESKPFPIKDGDVVQLGIDFKGGEEMIFRCVKIRIECNRELQKSLNKFNKSTHQHLRRLAQPSAAKDGETASKHSTECTICLNSIAPCQALFVAACNHTWHYKCIRNLIEGRDWPYFTCPNCRARHDLEADIEEPEDFGFDSDNDLEMAELLAATSPEAKATQAVLESAVPERSRHMFDTSSPLGIHPAHLPASAASDDDLAWAVRGAQASSSNTRRGSARNDADGTSPVVNGQTSSPNPGRMITPFDGLGIAPGNQSSSRTSIPAVLGTHRPLNVQTTAGGGEESRSGGVAIPVHDRHGVSVSSNDEASEANLESVGPMTPRNNAGPFVFDGASGGIIDEETDHDDGLDSLAGRVERF